MLRRFKTYMADRERAEFVQRHDELIWEIHFLRAEVKRQQQLANRAIREVNEMLRESNDKAPYWHPEKALATDS